MTTVSNVTPASFRKTLLVLAIGCGFLVSGCAVTPKPFSKEEIASINLNDRIAARSNMPAI